MTKILVLGAGNEGVIDALMGAGFDVDTQAPEAQRKYLMLNGERWPETDPRIFEPWPEPKEPRLIQLRDPTPEDLRRISAAKAKRERRQERNNISEARQGRPPDELEWRDGEWWAQCRSCGHDYPIEVEANRFSWAMNMCARNQWCIP